MHALLKVCSDCDELASTRVSILTEAVLPKLGQQFHTLLKVCSDCDELASTRVSILTEAVLPKLGQQFHTLLKVCSDCDELASTRVSILTEAVLPKLGQQFHTLLKVCSDLYDIVAFYCRGRVSWPSGLVHWTQVLVLSECGFESRPGRSLHLCPAARHLTIIASSFGWDVKLWVPCVV